MMRNHSLVCAMIGACWVLACGDDGSSSSSVTPDSGTQDAGVIGSSDAGSQDASTTTSGGTSGTTREPATSNGTTISSADAGTNSSSDAGTETDQSNTDDASISTSSGESTTSSDASTSGAAQTDQSTTGGTSTSTGSTTSNSGGSTSSSSASTSGSSSSGGSTTSSSSSSTSSSSTSSNSTSSNSTSSSSTSGTGNTTQSSSAETSSNTETSVTLEPTGDAGEVDAGPDASSNEEDASVDASTAGDAGDVAVNAVLVSGPLQSCTTATVNTGNKTAVDSSGRLYVLMKCGVTEAPDADAGPDAGADAGVDPLAPRLYVVSSSDNGESWSLPVDTGLTNIGEAAIEGGADGFGYVAAMTTSGDLVFTRTLDGGATWEATRTLDTGLPVAPEPPEVSIATDDDALYVAVSTSTAGLRLFRNFELGTGTFQFVDVAMNNNGQHDVIVDKSSGQVFLVSDAPELFIRVSSTQGATFGDLVEIDETVVWASDWAGANGNLYVTGTGTSFHVIPMSSPSTITSIYGLPQINTSRSIDADALGNVYIASVVSSAVQLDRLVINAEEVDPSDAITIANEGAHASVAALPSNTGALVAFTSDDSVWAAVAMY